MMIRSDLIETMTLIDRNRVDEITLVYELHITFVFEVGGERIIDTWSYVSQVYGPTKSSSKSISILVK